MPLKAQNNIQWLNSLQGVILAYQEISSWRMQKIRGSVLQNRQFLTEINDIFTLVKFSYQKDLKYPNQNPKRANILLTANTGLYGDIVERTFFHLKKEITNSQDTIIIIGQMGKVLFQEFFPKKPFIFFELADLTLDKDKIKEIITTLSQFEEVAVYHGLFKSLVTQDIIKSQVTGDIPSTPPTYKLNTIFEPTLDEVLVFFKTQISSSLFIQSLYESQLAKLSARMMALHQSQEGIQKALKVAKFEEKIQNQRINNRKQRQLLVNFSCV